MTSAPKRYPSPLLDYEARGSNPTFQPLASVKNIVYFCDAKSRETVDAVSFQPTASILFAKHAIRVQNRFFIQTIVNASALAKATLRRSLRIITTPNHPDFWCPKQPLPIHATCPEGLFCLEDRAYSQRPG